MKWQGGGWDLEVLVSGYPGKAVLHGGLGWSTVVLLRGHGRIVVLDGGGYGLRSPLARTPEAARHRAGRRDRPAAEPFRTTTMR